MLVESWGLFDQNHSINQIVEPSGMISYAAAWHGEERNPLFRSVYHDGKERMLRGIWSLLDDADIVIGWNSKSFDVKHIHTEFSLIGIGEPSPYRHIDLLQVCRKKFKHDSNKLDWIAQRYFQGKKLDYGQSHSDLLRGCESGDREAMKRLKEYNVQDALLPLGIYREWKDLGWL
jgi:DNA polymerase III epsilon subunit-like protein